MPFKKGESGNPAGRPKKSVQRISHEVRQEVSYAVQDNIPVLVRNLATANPIEHRRLMTLLMPLVIDKQCEIPFHKMDVADLDLLIERIKEKNDEMRKDIPEVADKNYIRTRKRKDKELFLESALTKEDAIYSKPKIQREVVYMRQQASAPGVYTDDAGKQYNEDDLTALKQQNYLVIKLTAYENTDNGRDAINRVSTGNEINMSVSRVFEQTTQADTRTIVNQGGTRSSKTYSICQAMICRLLKEQGKVLTICRKTLPSLRMSVMRDFFSLLDSMHLYDEAQHDKTHNTYTLNDNLVEFISMDEPQKKRGAKRDYLWMNEANEFTLEDYRQLTLRTTGKVYLDYNPSDTHHWIYDQVLTNANCTFIQSTYLDNPFLDAAIREEIERYKEVDENYWKVFGLGERGVSNTTIYTHWQEWHTDIPAGGDTFYGLDFGYNSPSALVQVTMKDNIAYAREIVYRAKLTTADIIECLKAFDIPQAAMIYADAAEPQSIEEIYRAGWRGIKAADKSVGDGIRHIKQSVLYITTDSVNMTKEIRNYKWHVDKNGMVMDEPVKINDHAMDALRYALHTYSKRPSGKYLIL